MPAVPITRDAYMRLALARISVFVAVAIAMLSVAAATVWAQSQPVEPSAGIVTERTLIPLGALLAVLSLVSYVVRKLTKFEDRLQWGEEYFRRIETRFDKMDEKLDSLPCCEPKGIDVHRHAQPPHAARKPDDCPSDH